MVDVEATRAAVRSWIATAWDRGLTVRAWWTRLAESGWGYPTWSPEWFGRNLSAAEARAVREELATAGVLGPPAGMGPNMGAAVLFGHGTEEQKRRWLPSLAKGLENWCQFFSEPNAGSDLASVHTRAVRDGSEWIVNGQKVWNSGTLAADRGLLIARTDPDQPKHAGLSFFVIDVDQPGLEVRPIQQMNGRAEFNETFFTDARVADDARIDEVGAGFRVAMTTLTSERAAFAGGGDHLLRRVAGGEKAGNLDRTVGDVLDAGLDDGVGNANTPPFHSPEALIALARDFGRTDDPVIRQELARIYALSEALRLTERRVQAAEDRGGSSGAASSIGYLGGVRLLRRFRDAVGSIAGPAGTLSGPQGAAGGEVATTILTVPCHGIQGGSEQIQMNIIGERILGLPKEPQVDRDVPFRETLARA
jgi:alkylation response protein AidB-like acyl-CoA dehydrogenase